MHCEGHVGAALLAYAPVGIWLGGAGHEQLAVVGAATMIALATVPDWDKGLPFLAHRGITHTVPFALGLGAVVGSAGVAVPALGPPLVVGTVGFLLGTLSVLVHVAVDALTPMGVRPFWPLSGRRYSLALVRSANPLANYLLFALGVAASLAALWLG